MFDLYNLIANFNNNLNCNMNCGECEYGVLKNYGDNFSCHLDLVEDMVYAVLRKPELWEELHG